MAFNTTALRFAFLGTLIFSKGLLMGQARTLIIPHRTLLQAPAPGPTTPQAAIITVLPGSLAILPDGFSRDVENPWQDTSIPATHEGSGLLGESLGIPSTGFVSFSPSFSSIIGTNPAITTLAENSYPFAHEAPLYLPDSNEVFFISNLLGNKSSPDQYVELWAINIDGGALREIIPNPPLGVAGGAARFNGSLYITIKGNIDIPAGVAILDPATGSWQWVLNNFFGLAFDSPNDVVVAKDGAVWFADDTYGNEQGFKGTPQLGQFVWRYVPGGAPARVVADGFSRSNGLALSNDESILYVSDTGFTSTPRAELSEPLGPRTIYAFDIIKSGGGLFAANRRVFAFTDAKIPDGIKTDLEGNVYGACGDGIQVWAPSGDLLGKILVSGGAANFAFAGAAMDQLVIMNEERVVKVQIRAHQDASS